MVLHRLHLRRQKLDTVFRVFQRFSSLPNAADSALQPKPTSLSARMSFLFEQIDEIDKQREQKDQTLQRIRSWRESKKQQELPSSEEPKSGSLEELESELHKSEDQTVRCNVKKEVELVHPWPEWIELMERLVQQNYFDHRRKDEVGMMQSLGFDMSKVSEHEEKGVDFMRDYETLRIAVINFGKDRFDILRSLSRQDIQMMVGYGCASTDKRVVFSSKLLRKHVHLDEGDVCSSCSLRCSCEKAYLLTNKEDEARTIDVMRILLTYGFDPIDGSVINESLMKKKFLKASVRKLLHDVVKLSLVPIDPNLSPPVIKRPPPKVKQTPPPPKKKVGRYDIEMKKGDWLCPKCDFMNFAKNTVCIQCDAKRPKRQLLPGEWECPQCNFLNYRRNVVCFQCEHNRPPDTYGESLLGEKQQGSSFRMEKLSGKTAVSNAWNIDFDDNESDGADVAAFEYADSRTKDRDLPQSTQGFCETSRAEGDGFERISRKPKFSERNYADSSSMKSGIGFNDFDDEDDDVDSYDVVASNEVPQTSGVDFSELELDSGSEDMENTAGFRHAPSSIRSLKNGKKHLLRKAHISDSEEGGVDFTSDDELPVHRNWKSSHVANPKQGTRKRNPVSMSSDDDLDFSSGSDDATLISKKKATWRSSDGMKTAGRVRGGRCKADFSSIESDDDFGHDVNKQFGKARQSHKGRTFQSGLMSKKRSSQNNAINSSSRSQGNNKGIEDNSYNELARPTKAGNFSRSKGPKRGQPFNKNRGISKNFVNQSDDYQNDERHRRTRVNVR